MDHPVHCTQMLTEIAIADPPGGEGDVLRAVEGRDRQPVQVHVAGSAVPRDAHLDGPPLPRRTQLRRRRRSRRVLLARPVPHRRPGEHRPQRAQGKEQVGQSGPSIGEY